jgi:hypothetical protein
MKMATAYKMGDRIFLHASCKTTAGVWILCRPVLAIDQGDLGNLGAAILHALDGSQENVPHPIVWKDLFNPILQLARVKSWTTFAKSAKCVEIEFGTNRVSFLPTKNLGPKDGFEPLESKRRNSSPTKEEAGVVLLAAFGDAE